VSWGGGAAYVRSEKRHTYTVHADDDQAERWEAAAAVQGRGMVVGTWLAETADAYLRELAKAGRPLPLSWYRGRFRVVLTDSDKRPPVSREEEVAGMVSEHFGIFRGDSRGPGPAGCARYALVHRPTRRIIGTLAQQQGCKALAAELAALRIDWTETDPEKVVEGAPDQERAQALLRLFEKLTAR
jgi:hypothetical protein